MGKKWRRGAALRHHFLYIDSKEADAPNIYRDKLASKVNGFQNHGQLHLLCFSTMDRDQLRTSNFQIMLKNSESVCLSYHIH